VIVTLVFGSVGAFLFLTRQYEPSRVAVVITAPGFEDWAAGAQAEIGMEEVRGDVAVDYDVYTTTSSQEAETQMKSIAAAGTHLLILAIGIDMGDAVLSAAGEYPQQKFGLIGANLPGDNIASASFVADQGSFLAGVLAAFMAAEDEYSGIIGVLGAVETDPTISELVDGFVAGVRAANASYNLGVQLLANEYLGSYNNTALAESRIYSKYVADNASVMFTPVRASMPGIRAGLETVNQSTYFSWNPIGRLPLVIAAETNLDWYGNPQPEVAIGPSWITTSVVPRSDLAIYDIVNATLWDEYDRVGGVQAVYNLANSGVNITGFRFSSTYVVPISGFADAFQFYQNWIIANGTYPIVP
jgi:basic membrane protein A